MLQDQERNESVQSFHPLSRKGDYQPFCFVPAEEGGVPFRLYLRVVWNRRWIILAAALLTVVVVAIRTVRQKPTYNAVGTLEIEMPKQNVTNVQDFFPSAIVPDIYLQTQSKILSSGQLVERVMDKLNLSGDPKSASSESRLSEQLSFQGRLNVQVIKGSQLVQVGFESEDPAVAAKVVNQLMTVYIDQIQEERSETANGASGWLMGQLKEAKAKLDQSMDALHSYEREHRMFSGDPDLERLTNIDGERLQQLQQELAQIETARMEKEALFRQVQAGDTQMLQSGLLEENLKKEADLEVQLTQLSKKFGPNFPQVQRAQAELSEVHKILATERDRLSREVESAYQSAVEQETRTQSEVEEQRKKVSGGSDDLTQDALMKRDVDLNEQEYEGLLQKFQEAATSANLKTVSARIVDPAEPPARSNHPGLLRNVALSLMMALIAGIGIALTEDLLRDTIKTAGEVESDLNLPLLGIVPAMSKLKLRASSQPIRDSGRSRQQGSGLNGKRTSGEWLRMDVEDEEHYELAEAIRNLRTSLLFALEGKGPQSILVSSSVPSEGKTTISSNISISLTQLGKKVLIIDGDLRRPSLHKFFSIPERAGLSEFLQGSRGWEEALNTTDVPGLDVIVCGERPQNPAELLSSRRMRTLIDQAKSRYDIVIVDSPTLLNMSDSRILASSVDGVVIIIKSRATPKMLARQACANVRGADAKIIGVVLNHLETGDSEYSYSDYGYPMPGKLEELDREYVSQD
jgi:succinoglycan biosynthesis transport protein ExoP